MQLMDILVNLNALLISFITVELLISLVLIKSGNGWKFRFGGRDGLNPFIKSWKATFVILILAVITIPILLSIVWSWLTTFLSGFGWTLILLLISTFSFTFVWILTNLIDKKWENVHTIFSIVCVSLFVLFIIANIL